MISLKKKTGKNVTELRNDEVIEALHEGFKDINTFESRGKTGEYERDASGRISKVKCGKMTCELVRDPDYGFITKYKMPGITKDTVDDAFAINDILMDTSKDSSFWFEEDVQQSYIATHPTLDMVKRRGSTAANRGMRFGHILSKIH